MNHYDSNKIRVYLSYYDKYFFVNSLLEADIIIFNTCSIRQKAEDKLFFFLDKIKNIKKNNSNIIVAVGGCISVQEKENIFLRNNIVDIIFGPQTLHKIVYFISEFKKKKKKIIDVEYLSIEKDIDFSYNFSANLNRRSLSYVSIMEGCNKFCSYCIVPYTRGREISRSPENIISEICRLSLYGIKEINLLGQNVNAYNGVFKNNSKCNFTCLLKLVSKIKGIKRIRFTTSHPSNFTDELINVYSKIKKIVNFLHLPIQSGSDRILKLMRRSYTIEYYKKLVKKILFVRKKMIFSSDFIVGFPTESEKDFKLTLNLISEIKFDSSFVFMYSPRPNTKSLNLLDNISLKEKKNRLYKINNLLNLNSIYWQNKMINTKQSILVENISKKNLGFYFGYTENNKIVYFKGNKKNLGKIINVKITKLYKNYLYGILI